MALLLEGTYPYVAGGVSSWVDQVLGAHADRLFALLHIGPYPGAYQKPVYTLPGNVVGMTEIYCRGGYDEVVGKRRNVSTAAVKRRSSRPSKSRVLDALRRMHLSDVVDDELLNDLAAGDLSVSELLHGSPSFQLCRELYDEIGNEAAFMDFFWHYRAMHVPLLRVLEAPCPRAGLLHAVSTGYAGVVGSVNSLRNGVPLVLTEHGLYARERDLELGRASWIQDRRGPIGTTRASPLRRFWSHYFRMLSRLAYWRASRIVTLSEDNRAKQLSDGADANKCAIVPNGVKHPIVVAPTGVDELPPRRLARGTSPPHRMRVGFVGRVVPIKDVVTLIRAVGLARRQVDLECWIIGPEDEDQVYAQRCHDVVKALGLEDSIEFLGPQKVSEIYPQLDALVLTSFSEGQPLVILEAFSHGLPVIATDVGACRELLEGGGSDKQLGHSGIVTRVANPADTAAAMVELARKPALRREMGSIGAARVAARYQLEQVVKSYDSLYSCLVSP
ncbi:MAG TPA: GT4 family glycosyltransferase PelF [Kofleriaceae bacterium]|nr:GT4 family glycosyltransferase PelF [Kofleriaceae bacterium]